MADVLQLAGVPTTREQSRDLKTVRADLTHEVMNGTSPKDDKGDDQVIVVPPDPVYGPVLPGDHDTDDDISIQIEEPTEAEASLTGSVLLPSDPQAPSSAPDGAEDDTNQPGQRRTLVRFRSRVRITSGMHRHSRTAHRHFSSSSSSSLAPSSRASSPSSSISAPLRPTPTPETSSPGWGTLGTRVSLFARARRKLAPGDTTGVGRGEGEPLLADGAPPSYSSTRGRRNSDESDRSSQDDDEATLSRQIDLMFGKWPWRLLNAHWWWWQLEPIVCCGCLDEEYD